MPSGINYKRISHVQNKLNWQACKTMLLHDNAVLIVKVQIFLTRVVNPLPILVAWVDYQYYTDL